MADLFNYKLGVFPFTYLGISIGDKAVRDKVAGKIINKLDNRLDNSKGSMLSSGGRLIMINSCLSSIPTYTMGFYRLNGEMHKRMDTIRSKFFWRGASNKFKYHLVNWKAICRPKDYGGLGVINTKLFNNCLLSKWFWKLDQRPNDLWFRILTAKYFSDGILYDVNPLIGSQFWKGINEVKHLFFCGGEA